MSEAFTPPPADYPAAASVPAPRRKGRLGFWIGLFGFMTIVLSFIAGFGAYQVMQFKARAEGIAIGYLEAAITAYQMDRYVRPLPDRIFETGMYRVEVKTTGTPPKVTISMRDRLVNITRHETSRLLDSDGEGGMPNTPNNVSPASPEVPAGNLPPT